MSKYQALIDALKAGPVQYACHIDGEVNDSCTFDAGQNLYDCVIAQGLQERGLCKRDCAEWKPISVVKTTIEVKAEDLRSLLADLERAEKYAERYRWLRNESWAGYNQSKRLPEVAESIVITRDGAGNVKTILAEEAMDAAIDAALSQLKGVQ